VTLLLHNGSQSGGILLSELITLRVLVTLSQYEKTTDVLVGRSSGTLLSDLRETSPLISRNLR